MSDGDKRQVRDFIEAICAHTTAINGLRYAVSGIGQANHSAVTRCDLSAAEARITAAIMNQRGSEDLAPLAALVVRAQKISSTLKVLSGKLTQLDSTTDSKTTAP